MAKGETRSVGVTPLSLKITAAGEVRATAIFSGPNAKDAVSDLATAVLATGGEMETRDLRTGEVHETQSFSGVGEGKWDEIKNNPRTRNGRLRIVHTRPAGPSTSEGIVQ